MKFTVLACLLICSILYIRKVNTANILAIIPIPSYSHQIPYRALWEALSRRGHRLVVLTTDPLNDPSLTNITEISFKHSYDVFHKLNIDFTSEKLKGTSWVELNSKVLNKVGFILAENIYKHPEVRKLYAPESKIKFDLVVAEVLLTPACYALAHRFNAPLIGVSSLGIWSYNHYLLGSPVLPSHQSTWEMEEDITANMSFWQRLRNFINLWKIIHEMFYTVFPMQQRLAEKYLGPDIPDIIDIARNMSIVFTNQQEAISFVRPNTPNIIPFGGFHIRKNIPPLPKDLEEFINNAPNGVIYVSLGTNVRISSFSNETQNIFFDVFSNLETKVIWKCDVDFPQHSENIYISRWLPQQSILAHPKVKMFVYQGGLQSTEEAVYNAVPLLGIPILADQDYQVNKMVSLGVANRLKIAELNKASLLKAIKDVLENEKYKEQMLKLKELLQDKPYNTLENAVWWVEFVIRHKGAPHLNCDIQYDPWYKRYDIDIIAFCSIIVFIAAIILLFVVYKILYIMFNNPIPPPKNSQKKKIK